MKIISINGQLEDDNGSPKFPVIRPYNGENTNYTLEEYLENIREYRKKFNWNDSQHVLAILFNLKGKAKKEFLKNPHLMNLTRKQLEKDLAKRFNECHVNESTCKIILKFFRLIFKHLRRFGSNMIIKMECFINVVIKNNIDKDLPRPTNINVNENNGQVANFENGSMPNPPNCSSHPPLMSEGNLANASGSSVAARLTSAYIEINLTNSEIYTENSNENEHVDIYLVGSDTTSLSPDKEIQEPDKSAVRNKPKKKVHWGGVDYRMIPPNETINSVLKARKTSKYYQIMSKNVFF